MQERIERRAKLILWGSMLLSVVLHTGASVVLSFLPSTSVALAAIQRERIQFEIEDEPPPAPEAAEPEAEPAPEAEPEVAEPDPQPREVTPPPEREPRPREESEPEPPAPQAEQVHDMGGMVLGATGPGAAWTTAAGTGQDTNGPIGNPVARTTGRDVAGRGDGVIGGTGTAPAPPPAPRVDRSRPPREPAGMARVLERYYPTGAHSRGIEGRARVMFRVLASGRAEPQSIASETPSGEGFGRACMDALRSSSGWTPAVDENGESTSSRLYPYNCRFRMR
ncbi:MAG: energy transducer TonB [Polyangiales bacterium]|nr:energy transducer TonB [Sandaracinaceae bacterium]